MSVADETCSRPDSEYRNTARGWSLPELGAARTTSPEGSGTESTGNLPPPDVDAQITRARHSRHFDVGHATGTRSSSGVAGIRSPDRCRRAAGPRLRRCATSVSVRCRYAANQSSCSPCKVHTTRRPCSPARLPSIATILWSTAADETSSSSQSVNVREASTAFTACPRSEPRAARWPRCSHRRR